MTPSGIVTVTLRQVHQFSVWRVWPAGKATHGGSGPCGPSGSTCSCCPGPMPGGTATITIMPGDWTGIATAAGAAIPECYAESRDGAGAGAPGGGDCPAFISALRSCSGWLVRARSSSDPRNASRVPRSYVAPCWRLRCRCDAYDRTGTHRRHP